MNEAQNRPEGSLGQVFIVDDDAAVRHTLATILSHAGYHVTDFAEGEAFLELARRTTPTCIFLDVHMPGMSGIGLLREIRADDYPAPIFIISGRGDITMAVEAIKAGAFDFIEKPFRSADLLKRMQVAIEAFAKINCQQPDHKIASFHFPGRPTLTRRECDALQLFTSGSSNKEAARELGLSPRTIEEHRANIMKKLGAKNAADLIRIVLTEGRSSKQTV